MCAGRLTLGTPVLACIASAWYLDGVPVLDTTPEAASVQTEVQRRLGTAGRFRTAVEMSEMTRKLARAGLRARHPKLNDRQVEQELLRELYGLKSEAR